MEEPCAIVEAPRPSSPGAPYVLAICPVRASLLHLHHASGRLAWLGSRGLPTTLAHTCLAAARKPPPPPHHHPPPPHLDVGDGGGASSLLARLRALLAIGLAPAPFRGSRLPQGLGLGQNPTHLLRSEGAQGLAGDVTRLGDVEQAGHHGLFAGRIHDGH